MSRHPRKALFIVGGCAIGTLLALIGVHDHLVDYLSLIGTFIPPVGGVLIVDILYRQRQGVPEGHTPRPVRSRHLAVYALAASLAWVSGELDIGIPLLIGIVVATALTTMLHRRSAESPTNPQTGRATVL